ncbi:hypothetical protein CALCODRAFT_555998 [Calocera cornea HHB12733]|uniref:F-box domain-containing protein n=1 Tax=Calocera cornea HHB12733 TaxID=1353952 RepID=A0A165F6L7_9BASI|nr:hypothetical protein CALCODRAFT_555998 [Calocera cornea HHB12733]
MHPIWAVSELVDTIAASLHSDKKSLCMLARVSHICFKGAAPILWEELDDIEMKSLFEILFVKSSEGAGSLITSSSCNRFVLYESYVVGLKFTGNLDRKSHMSLSKWIQNAHGLFSDKTNCWFPRLRRLRIVEHSNVEGLLLPLQFILPTLKEVHIDVAYPDIRTASHACILSVDSLLRKLCKSLQSLRAFSLTAFALPPNALYEASLLALFSTCQVRSVRMSLVTFTDAIASAVSLIPSLKVLSLEEESERSAESQESTPRCQKSGPLSVKKYPALKELVIIGRPTAVKNVLKSVEARLDRLTISLTSKHQDQPERITESDYLIIAELVAEHYPRLRHIAFHATLVPEDACLQLSYLKSLCRCSGMENVMLSTANQGIEMDDDDISAVAQSWPSLLCLCFYKNLASTHKAGAKQISWKSFVSLRRHCPRLELLAVPSFDASKSLPCPGPMPSLGISPGLYFTMHSPPEVSDPFRAALFLSTLWPDLHLISGEKEEWLGICLLVGFARQRSQLVKLVAALPGSLSPPPASFPEFFD